MFVPEANCVLHVELFNLETYFEQMFKRCVTIGAQWVDDDSNRFPGKFRLDVGTTIGNGIGVS